MSLRSLELDPKQHRSGLEKMSCTFTAIVCHSARVIDPTEEEPKQSEWGFPFAMRTIKYICYLKRVIKMETVKQKKEMIKYVHFLQRLKNRMK